MVGFPQVFASRSSAKKACNRGFILLNDELVKRGCSSKKTHANDRIEWRVRSQPGAHHPPPAHAISLRVIFEDGDLAIIVKPQGIDMNELKVSLSHSLQPAVAHTRVAVSDDGQEKELPVSLLNRPIHVHRLDKPTGGLVVVAKSSYAQTELHKMFAQREVQKRYRSVVKGKLEGGGEINADVDGKPSVSFFRAVSHYYCRRQEQAQAATSASVGANYENDWWTVVDLWPKTGRTHQLRKHVCHIGYPMLGDTRYTSTSQWHGARAKDKTDSMTSSNRTAGTGAGAENSNRTAGTGAGVESLVRSTAGSDWDVRVAEGDAVATAAEVPASEVHRPPDDTQLCLWAVAIGFKHPLTAYQHQFVLSSDPPLYASLFQDPPPQKAPPPSVPGA
jgi:RluA family pseudouridine synthase